MNWEGNDGGFINDSIAEEPQQLTSSVSIGDAEKSKAIAAVSVSQISKLTRPSEGLVLHGKKIYHVKLVAFVHEILDINPQKVHILVDDFTSGGPLEVSHIIGDHGTPDEDPSLSMFNEDAQNPMLESPSKNLAELKPGDYVRCVGVVKYNQDKAYLVGYDVKFVEDPNEITMHILETIRDSMYFERLQRSGGVGPVIKDERPPGGMTGNTGQQKPTMKDQFGKLAERERHVLSCLKRNAPPEGMTENRIAEQLKGIPRADIKDALESLAAEGLCWQGDAEDSWCVVTEN